MWRNFGLACAKWWMGGGGGWVGGSGGSGGEGSKGPHPPSQAEKLRFLSSQRGATIVTQMEKLLHHGRRDFSVRRMPTDALFERFSNRPRI